MYNMFLLKVSESTKTTAVYRLLDMHHLLMGTNLDFCILERYLKISRLVACSPGFRGLFAPALLFVEGH